MKRIYLFFALVISASMSLRAGITAYTFTSEKWASKVGATICDGKTDGWTSDKDGSEYSKGRDLPSGDAVQRGVKAGRGVSGVGATSVKEFTDVRRITFNLCQNSSGKGKGVIYVQVGQGAIDSIVVTDQKMSDSQLNRDSIIYISTPNKGKIRFWINTQNFQGNAIYINTITIRAEEGGSTPFTQDSYQLVTDIHSLRDSDQVIFGVADNRTKMIMGYYDERISQNNVHAIKGTYNTSRTQVDANDLAIYTLWKDLGANDQDTVYVFEDVLRYDGGLYLVANGGRSKNKLALWYDVVSSAYGNNGFWRMTIDKDGSAVIENAGLSERKYMQYNQSDKLFGCYADPNSQTKVCLYHLVKAIGTDDPAIAANMVNFGNVRLNGESVSGETRVEINANKLTEDITCSLKQGSVFSLGSNIIDRDGDYLTIRYSATQAGKYMDTLVLTSTGVCKEVNVMINVVAEKSIAEVSQCSEFEFVYLNPVVVTKKYDQYVFIRDASGSMLIWDTENPETGKRYAQDVEKGSQLSNVQGRFRNYFGVPELTPTAAWTEAAQKAVVNPDTVLTVDSADVCRYVYMDSVVVDAEGKWQGVPVVESFQTGRVITNIRTQLESIVMIDHNAVQLWVVKQEIPTGINECRGERTERTGKYLRNGQLYIRNNGRDYNANGQTIK